MKMIGLLIRIALIPISGLLLGLCTAEENETSRAGDLQMHSTIESIGVVFEYAGDENQDNQAVIQYRQVNHPDWLLGHEMVVDRSTQEWKGSLIYLEPDTRYEIRINLTDPDGVSEGIITGEIKTRPEVPEYGQTRTTYYVPDDGDFVSVIELAGPGDKILVRTGVYYTGLILDEHFSGEQGAYISIESEPGGDVVLDGSDPKINDQSVDNWLPYNEKIFFTDLEWGDIGCKNRTLPGYVGQSINGDSVRYLLYEGSDEWGDFLISPPGSAYYDCDRRLYVKTYQVDDPDLHEMNISKNKTGIVLAGADYIRIKRLEMRYYSDYGIHLANPGADNNVIEGNIFHGIGLYHIRIGQSSPKSSDNLIQDNYFYEKGFRDSGWTWSQQYRQADVIGVRLLDAGPGNVIRRNSFMSGTDGISIVNRSHDTDVYENKIFDCMDDGIEVDNEPGQNIRIWGNDIHFCFSGISVQDWFTGDYFGSGPVYIFRNMITGGNDPQERTSSTGEIYHSAYAFKVGSDMDYDHHVFYYHNTIMIPDSFLNGNGFQDAGGLYFSGAVSRNNKFSVTRYVFNFRRQSTVNGHDFNCDSLFSSRMMDRKPFIQWTRNGGPDGDGSYTNLNDFQAATAQEKNGIVGDGLSNQWLDWRSSEIDSGCVITGFNDRVPKRYFGNNPDIGAYELRSLHLLMFLSQFLHLPQ